MSARKKIKAKNAVREKNTAVPAKAETAVIFNITDPEVVLRLFIITTVRLIVNKFIFTIIIPDKHVVYYLFSFSFLDSFFVISAGEAFFSAAAAACLLSIAVTFSLTAAFWIRSLLLSPPVSITSVSSV